MINYTALLHEAISSIAYKKASALIRAYLTENLATQTVFLFPETFGPYDNHNVIGSIYEC